MSHKAIYAVVAALFPMATVADCPEDCNAKCCTTKFGVTICEQICSSVCAASNALCGKPTLPPVAPVTPQGTNARVEQLGQATITTVQRAGGDTLRTLQEAGGATVSTLRKGAGDAVTTFVKAGQDATATYVKAWRDSSEQARKSFQDTVDAANAVKNYAANQARTALDATTAARKRLQEGKVVDAMWGLAVEPLQGSEANFAKATQESQLIAAAASSAAAAYGGPAGAAAYAAWSTYRATGNADQALRAGLLAAATTQTGGQVTSMPAGTLGEVIQKSAMAGAAGGIAVAAAGGDEKAVTDGFLRSSGAVLIQAGSDNVKAYSPRAKDAWETVHCISARDVDCLSRTTWAKDAKGKILTQNGKPLVDSRKIDPQQYFGRWSRRDPASVEGKKQGFMTQLSKLPGTQAIPLMKNKWMLTWTLGNSDSVDHGQPTAVLTYMGEQHSFVSKVQYGTSAPDWLRGEAGVRTADYRCMMAGMERTVTVSRQGGGCESVYRRADGQQEIVWHSDHFPEVCAGKAAAFVDRLRGMGMDCRER